MIINNASARAVDSFIDRRVVRLEFIQPTTTEHPLSLKNEFQWNIERP